MGYRLSLLLAFLAGVFASVAGSKESGNPDLFPHAIWSQSATFKAGMGFKDNVLLSRFGALESPYVVTGIEYFLFRPEQSANSFLAYVSADDIRYLAAGAPSKDQMILALLEGKHRFSEAWVGAMKIQYVYQDQFFDASVVDAVVGSVRALGSQIAIRPNLRRYFGSSYFAEVELNANRVYLVEPLDDYWEVGPKVSFGRSFGHSSEWSISYSFFNVPFDHREAIGADGFNVPGSHRTLQQHRAEAGLKYYFEEKKQWRSNSRLGVLRNLGNISGYFDLTKAYAVQDFTYKRDWLELRGGGGYARYSYDVQTANSISAIRRQKERLTAYFTTEVRLGKGWKWHVDYDYERSLSNVPLDAYRANTVASGLIWEWER